MSLQAIIQTPDIQQIKKNGSKENMTTIQRLFEELNASHLRYCHWKSNILLTDSIAGRTDIDLLIDRKDADLFRDLIIRLHFRPAITMDGDPFPSVEHYYALDEESGILVHVHAYYRVITGESLTKNYRFPIEDMLLTNIREEDNVRVPNKSAELVVFTLRIMLKHTSIVELLLLSRYWKKVKEEIDYLIESDTIEETIDLVDSYLPSVNTKLFSRCIDALSTQGPLYQRIYLGYKLRSQLKFYTRHSALSNWLNGIRKFSIMFYRRFAKSQKSINLRSGGAIIAFVGSEATGKSTLLTEMREWLGEHFAVEQIHVGKPPSTGLTYLPNVFLPFLRSLFPEARTTNIDIQKDLKELSDKPRKKYPLFFSIRSVLLGYDRRSLLLRSYRNASNGTIVLCDRYPSREIGAPDSPQLPRLSDSNEGSSIRDRLAKIEAKLYKDIPSPDLVIYLTAPIEVTISRNAARSKYEPEDYVRHRHARSSNLKFGKTTVYKINTDQAFDRTVLEIKKAIWDVL